MLLLCHVQYIGCTVSCREAGQEANGALLGLYTHSWSARTGQCFQHMSFADLARLLAISRARVSQLHGRALSRVRAMYERTGEDGGYY